MSGNIILGYLFVYVVLYILHEIFRGNRPYAWLRQFLKFHHQASFMRNYSQPLARAYCFHVSILFIFGALEIGSWWNLQVYISKARLGGEIS